MSPPPQQQQQQLLLFILFTSTHPPPPAHRKQCLALTIAALAIYTPLYQESGAFKEATNKVTKAVTWNR